MDKQTIMRLISTLNSIEVKGKDNLNYLLGCIQTLEEALNAPAAENETKEGSNG